MKKVCHLNAVFYFLGSQRRLSAENNWCFRTVLLETNLESPLDSKEINLTGNQPRIFIGRTDAETPVLWPPEVKSQLLGKDPDAGKD